MSFLPGNNSRHCLNMLAWPIWKPSNTPSAYILRTLSSDISWSWILIIKSIKNQIAQWSILIILHDIISQKYLQSCILSSYKKILNRSIKKTIFYRWSAAVVAILFLLLVRLQCVRVALVPCFDADALNYQIIYLTEWKFSALHLLENRLSHCPKGCLNFGVLFGVDLYKIESVFCSHLLPLLVRDNSLGR